MERVAIEGGLREHYTMEEEVEGDEWDCFADAAADKRGGKEKAYAEDTENAEPAEKRKAYAESTEGAEVAGKKGGRSGAVAHQATALGSPVNEAGESSAIFPGEVKELFGVEMGGFLAKEGFKAPLEIGTVPRPEAIAPGGNPVVAERLPHRGILHRSERSRMKYW